MSLDAQLAALSAMSPAALRAAWRDAYRTPPPAITPELMARAVAARLQERRHGGLPGSVAKEIARLTARLRRGDDVVATHEVRLKPGTRLVRGWRGRTINVLVTADGFEFEGRQYGSLTRITHEVTGTSWSGPRFFGLRGRKAVLAGKVDHRG
nr:DUF2924 domain-containing protein [Polymorphobacter sp.]